MQGTRVQFLVQEDPGCQGHQAGIPNDFWKCHTRTQNKKVVVSSTDLKADRNAYFRSRLAESSIRLWGHPNLGVVLSPKTLGRTWRHWQLGCRDAFKLLCCWRPRAGRDRKPLTSLCARTKSPAPDASSHSHAFPGNLHSRYPDRGDKNPAFTRRRQAT